MKGSAAAAVIVAVIMHISFQREPLVPVTLPASAAQ